jgi:hypothetical protein
MLLQTKQHNWLKVSKNKIAEIVQPRKEEPEAIYSDKLNKYGRPLLGYKCAMYSDRYTYQCSSK